MEGFLTTTPDKYSIHIVFCPGVPVADPVTVAFLRASQAPAGHTPNKEKEALRPVLWAKKEAIAQMSPTAFGFGDLHVDHNNTGNVQWNIQVNDISKVTISTHMVAQLAFDADTEILFLDYGGDFLGMQELVLTVPRDPSLPYYAAPRQLTINITQQQLSAKVDFQRPPP
jgi:hypothetical protein